MAKNDIHKLTPQSRFDIPKGELRDGDSPHINKI